MSTDDRDKRRGWHSRGYLPHFDGEDTTQSVTFRLGDSIPAHVVRAIREEAASRSSNPARIRAREVQIMQKFLDKGYGSCVLRRPEAAKIVQDALLFFDGDRYRMHGWVVMPNHVHVIFTPNPGRPLELILHSWKSFTSNQINAVLNRSGQLWMPEYFDRFIRSPIHFTRGLNYIHWNPVKAGLCKRPEDWSWTSAEPEVF